MNFFSKLKDGLFKTRKQISTIISSEDELNDSFYESIEDALVSTDIGLDLSLEIIDHLKDEIRERNASNAEEAYALLKEIIVNDLSIPDTSPDYSHQPWVILVVGVNGVGKTTTIGKMAQEFCDNDKSVIFGAVDTFRAGAIEQLKIWADRTGSDIVTQHEGADPASVAFDSLEAAKARNSDILILDTAGRLHNKTNLMNELEKILRVLKRNTSHVPHEILLVVDATTGQNAISQVDVFNKILGLTGLIITKLDGTAKGGIALSLAKKFSIPIRKIGIGEGVFDLQNFDPKSYVDAMFGDIKDMNNS
ncbi:MAG: signal recognition particle-docking protein FtsY [Chitinispirillia bacterium]|jgi:fused signal recognition particle receptor